MPATRRELRGRAPRAHPSFSPGRSDARARAQAGRSVRVGAGPGRDVVSEGDRTVGRYARIRLDRIARSAATRVAAPGYAIALYDIGGRLVAVDDACLRCGASLGAGQLVGGLAICVGCGWVYDIASGAVEGLPALRLERFDVGIDGADARISLPAGAIEQD